MGICHVWFVLKDQFGPLGFKQVHPLPVLKNTCFISKRAHQLEGRVSTRQYQEFLSLSYDLYRKKFFFSQIFIMEVKSQQITSCLLPPFLGTASRPEPCEHRTTDLFNSFFDSWHLQCLSFNNYKDTYKDTFRTDPNAYSTFYFPVVLAERTTKNAFKVSQEFSITGNPLFFLVKPFEDLFPEELPFKFWTIQQCNLYSSSSVSLQNYLPVHALIPVVITATCNEFS